MWQELFPALRITLALTLLTGLAYPLLITGVCQALFPRQANGSLMERDGKVIGSALIGQSFARPEYFRPRPSAAGNGYDASLSGGSNLGPTSKKLIDRVTADVAAVRKDNPSVSSALPADMVTASGSGLDPHISPANAALQMARVAAARHTSPDAVQRLVAAATEGPDLGVLGEPRVNVLLLNLALDRDLPVSR